MKNKLLSLIAAFVIFIPSLGYSVGLGAVKTYSYLNQELRAEIPVLSVKSKSNIMVGLAPNYIFLDKGVARTQVLNDLKFLLVYKNKRVYVKITSNKRIVSPYLNFILELKASEGTVYREYAIFLDPPDVNRDVKGSYIHNAKLNRVVKNRVNKPVKKNSKKANNYFYSSSLKGRKYGPVKEGETLWSIASFVRPSKDISIANVVSALKKANPRDLSGVMKPGVILNIPDFGIYNKYSKIKYSDETKSLKKK